MLLKQYIKEFCRPPNPEARHLRCVAYLDENISDVLPYLNTVLNGHQYIKKPPSLTLKFNGKLITLYAKEIGINIVKDEDEADNILKWLKKEINDTWKRRKEIEPSFEVVKKPGVLDILKRLPKTNCQECGQPTCMVFAVLVAEGKKNPENCPQLDVRNKIKLQEYLEQFKIFSR
ncbi:MAG: (Fe-S)-binding protein [Desulfobacterales bacterium]|jgi:ArsR family metal-binding transcriptional regulator